MNTLKTALHAKELELDELTLKRVELETSWQSDVNTPIVDNHNAIKDLDAKLYRYVFYAIFSFQNLYLLALVLNKWPKISELLKYLTFMLHEVDTGSS